MGYSSRRENVTLLLAALYGWLLRSGPDVAPVRAMRRLYHDLLRPVFGSLDLPAIILISTAAGVGEEILFRDHGILHRRGSRCGLACTGRLLFGLDKARKPIRAADQAVIVEELPDGLRLPAGGTRHNLKSMNAPFASGSNAPDAMVVIPCTMGTLGRIKESDELVMKVKVEAPAGVQAEA
jgi:hypothetical protein